MLLLILTYVALVLETAPLVQVGGLAPSPLWVVAAAAVWSVPGTRAVFWCGVAGLLSDSLSNGPLGIGLTIGAILGWLVSTVRIQGRLDSAPAFFLMTLALAALFRGTVEPARRIFERMPVGDLALLRDVIGRSCLTALAGVVLFVAVRSVLPRKSQELGT